jgi:hypothetical protein
VLTWREYNRVSSSLIRKEADLARSRYELWGESVREIGVLLLVFVPVDVLLEMLKDRKFNTHAHWVELVIAASVGLALILLGTEVERT